MKRYPTNKAFRKALIERFPAAKNDSAYMVLLRKLLFSRGEEVLLHSNWLAAINGVDRKHFNSQKFLTDFQREVLPYFEFSEFSVKEKKCRKVLFTGLNQQDYKLLELLDHYDVWLDDGSRITSASVKENRNEQLKSVEKHHTDYGQQIMDYHNHKLSTKLLRALINKNTEAAWEVILSIENEDTRFMQTIIMCNIEIDTPIMRPAHLSDRIFTMEPNINDLYRPVRKALLSGCIDVDLKSLHLKLAAHLLDIKELKDFFAAGNGFWNEFPAEAKESCKTAIYTLVYGGTTKRVREDWKCESFSADDFLNHRLIAPLVKAQRAKLASLRYYNKDGRTPSEKFAHREQLYHPVTKARIFVPSESRMITQKDGTETLKRGRDTATRKLALWFQAYELRLVYAIYEVMFEREDFSIVLIQHDGVTLKLRDARDALRIHKDIQKAVRKVGEELGIPDMTVSWEEL